MQHTNVCAFGTYFREAAIVGFCKSSLFMFTAETLLCPPVFIAPGIALHNCYCPGFVSYLQSKIALEFPSTYYKLKKKIRML